MKLHQITIKDIAKELNLSKSTVSRVLTGNPNVKAETRKLVLDFALKVDYQKNLFATNLVTQKSNIIGIMVPEFMSSYFPKVIIGAQNKIATEGFNLIIAQSNESYETEVSNARVMMANQVDGLLVSVTKETRNFDHFMAFKRKGIPLVFFNRVCEDMDVPKVVADDYDGAFKAVEHLIKIGKKRIAHLAGPDNLSISRRRLNGYYAALRKYNIPVDEELIISYDLTMEKVKIYINHLLSLSNPPDALFAINDPTAIEAIQVIKARGLSIPEDIAVIGFSNDEVSALIEPALTTIAQPIDKIGETAAEMLLHLINTEISLWKPITKTMTTELIIRKSTIGG
jgi:LacI family transcriptional regulator/LacI family repressor for deo operon, udp, cdd, tsx, nupC, and nupG